MNESSIKMIETEEDVKIAFIKKTNHETDTSESKEVSIPSNGFSTFDDILVIIGEFGRYQKLLYLMFSITYIMTAMQLLGWVFIGAKTPFRCLLPSEVNQSETAKYSDFPQNSSSSCSYQWNDQNISTCDLGYVYDTSNVRHTAIMEWNLLCENEGRLNK